MSKSVQQTVTQHQHTAPWPPEGRWLSHPWMPARTGVERGPGPGNTFLFSGPGSLVPKDAWLKSIRHWVPDLDPKTPNWSAVKRILLTQFGYKPAECEKLSVEDVVGLFDSKNPQPRKKIISTAKAIKIYAVTAKTLSNNVGKTLTDYRTKPHRKNAPLRLDEDEVAGIWPPRSRQ